MRQRGSISYESGHVWPPPPPERDETEEQRAERLEQEREAKRVSDEIDKAIEQQREEMKKRRPQMKILLLGQAESGKSTMLKNFQLQFTPKAFKAESGAWRAVIHLNLVRSVNFILDLLSPNPRFTHAGSPASVIISGSDLLGQQQPQYVHTDGPVGPIIEPTPELKQLRMRLSPLKRVEEMLSKRISADDPNPVRKGLNSASEVSVRSGSGWKALARLSHRTRPASPDELEDAGRVIEACRDDIIELWADPVVQKGLKSNEIALQEQSGFFLNEVSRIAVKDYTPTPEDILKARLQTMGVEEHRLIMETATESGKEWVIYDVGGSRGQRPAWAPFFDDVNAIIFLAPISAFNQTLSEDKSVNRLWDSFYLWQSICTNRILANVTIILLLNKVDVLEAKLQAGVNFSKYVTSYKDQPNDVEHVSKYLKAKFSAIHRQHSNRNRKLHIHLTTATDHRATSIILVRIREVILTNNLIDSDFV
ncbi:G-alpha-domain-containing protein [Gloeophyllum trabeum ATCC 11539]|uniref:G-alpha-domain-containing protein n=1 Tax=Gloeophyllum trabeum (strain ATCC 11539 / FP-39264 / Madison 617) TaxID=670483 RepID=S7RLL2_GLOTA|nr:G-alpha-domain-containing protein [Gloeophyllum trabeum ATCC 11539]EPQ53559.1 G-alpha-domain-containing protein [Gloeophyllum trabeum ATCC 11539]